VFLVGELNPFVRGHTSSCGGWLAGWGEPDNSCAPKYCLAHSALQKLSASEYRELVVIGLPHTTQRPSFRGFGSGRVVRGLTMASRQPHHQAGGASLNTR